MKRFYASSVLAALFAITMVATGCGGNKSTNPANTIPGAPGYPYQGGLVQPLPGGAAAISFTGTNVYSSGVAIRGMTTNFYPNTPGTITLAPVNMPVGQPGTIQKSSYFDPNSGIALMLTPTSTTYTSATANVAGIVTLSQQFIQGNFGGALPAVMGLAIDLWTTNSQVVGGTVWICTRQDQTGCHGAYLTL